MTKARVTQRDLASGLRQAGIRAGDLVLAHSSLSAFGYVEGGADAVLDALLDVLGPAGTLVLPTFTWGEFHKATDVVFDVAATPCETGRIPETFRLRPGVRRSIHLCHSMAACGPATEAVLANGVHSFWHGSSFDALYERNAWDLMLGVTFNSCTALHAAEEKASVPYRAYRDYPDCRVRLPNGELILCPSLEFLRQDNSFNDFAKMESIFRDRDLLTTVQIGDAKVMNIRIRDVIDTACELLAEDIRFLSGTR